ncbi:hypothetical protein YC2023_112801 [Brassica napus]
MQNQDQQQKRSSVKFVTSLFVKGAFGHGSSYKHKKRKAKTVNAQTNPQFKVGSL